ncbi:hypothetical protein AXI59_15670 [Bacillus nakamurai]|uniref:hypothetical protein n=1 Tax=Bacillus nakamurai TaxID=1793963 RepID=UPI0007786A51|nr:hypothetical protein [Bacillus nakamurai]KXZ18971.1 hypothetical protein AXI59_15670 [Bacillus nakamurai]MCC9021501.1 hypothetical protein [Bacillus nakamurai]
MEILNFKYEGSYFEIHIMFSTVAEFNQVDRDIQAHVREISKSILKAATGFNYFLNGATYIKNEEDNSVFCSFILD